MHLRKEKHVPSGERANSAPLGASSRLDQRGRRIRTRFLILVSLSIALIAVGAGFMPAGCGSETDSDSSSTSPASGVEPAASFPVTLTDDHGTVITIPSEPLRIVSTAPSNTEILFALGLGNRVVGVSSLDDYPPEAAVVPKIGDFQVNPEAVIACDPDLVLGFLGNDDGLTAVSETGIPVLVFDPASLDGVYSDIETIGRATGAVSQADELVTSIKNDVEAIAKTARETGASPRIFYALDTALWTAGPGSFLDELIRVAGGINIAEEVAGGLAQPYYQFAPEQLVAADPDVILLANTAYKTTTEFTRDPRFAGLKAVEEDRVMVVDDVLITRPGPRIARGLEILAAAIHSGSF